MAVPESLRVAVLGLGGTIAMTDTPAGGVGPALSAAQLTAAVPGLAATGIDLVVHDVRRRPGASLTFDDLDDLAGAVDAQVAGGVSGVVVTQGTDTIEETAYALDLRYPGGAPVVVTGAMRNPTLAGADGPGNLLAAVQAAASPELRGQGVIVVLADEIHAARRVRKTHSTSGATFASPSGGALGYVVEGQPRLLNRVPNRTVVPRPSRDRQVRVALVTVSLGDDGELLAGLGERFDGLVVAAFGAGHVPEPMVAPLSELAGRIPVVLASRTGSGPVLASTYGFPGSERDLLSRGLISAGFLDPYKARILLRAALAADADHPKICAAFAAAGGVADPVAWPWAPPATTPSATASDRISCARL